MDIFSARHLGVELCSFLHQSFIDIDLIKRRSPFLMHAIIALAALYMTAEDVNREGFAKAGDLSEWHASIARDYSRQYVDSPSSKTTLQSLDQSS